MRGSQTIRMVQGAMIAALFGVVALLNTYTGGILDVFLCYGMVIPLAWYGYHYSLKENIVVSFVSFIIVVMMGLPFFIISSITSCLAGLFIGEALKRKWSKDILLIGTFIVMFIGNILIYEVFAGILEMDMISEMTETYQWMISTFPSLSNSLSLNMLLSLIPMILIIMSSMEMYVVLLLCQLVLGRLQVEFPGQFHIAFMHLNAKTGIVISILTFLSYILRNTFHIDYFVFVYIYTFGLLIFGLQGLSFLSYYMIVKGYRVGIIFVFLGIFVPGLNMLYVIFGILDIFSDLREKLLYNSNNHNR